MAGGKAHIGEHVVLGLVHEACELGQFRPQLIGHLAPLRFGGLGAVLGEGGGDEGGDDAPLLLPAWASAFRMI